MKKYLILLITCIFFTGCSVEHNITINKDLSIDEQIDASETEKYFDDEFTYYERKDAIDTLLETMSPRFDNIGYNYEHNFNDTGIIAKNKYDSIYEYINNNKIYKQYFENIEYDENGNIITIKSTGEFYPYTAQDFEKFAIDKYELNITIPFKVIKNNADAKKGNTYIWHIDKKTKNKSIFIKFDSSKNAKTINSEIDFKIIFGIILVVSIITIYIYYRIKKNDNIM